MRLSSTGKFSVLSKFPQSHFTLTVLPLTFLSRASISFPKVLSGKPKNLQCLSQSKMWSRIVIEVISKLAIYRNQ
jgi:hypothetical protein